MKFYYMKVNEQDEQILQHIIQHCSEVDAAKNTKQATDLICRLFFLLFSIHFLCMRMLPVQFLAAWTAKSAPLILYTRYNYQFMALTAVKPPKFPITRQRFRNFSIFIVINNFMMMFSTMYIAINMMPALRFKRFMTYRTYFFHK